MLTEDSSASKIDGPCILLNAAIFLGHELNLFTVGTKYSADHVLLLMHLYIHVSIDLTNIPDKSALAGIDLSVPSIGPICQGFHPIAVLLLALSSCARLIGDIVGR
jgi:hypothetical protein